MSLDVARTNLTVLRNFVLTAVCCGAIIFCLVDLAVGRQVSDSTPVIAVANLTSEREESLSGPVPRKDGRRDILPNIIVINLDDADRDSTEIDLLRGGTYRFLPNIDRLAIEGIRFVNMHATSPLCAPSRASFFTGQYAHKHGFKSNDPNTDFSRGVTGGFQHFRDFGGFDSREMPSLQNEIGVWMKQSGYRTMLVGKYLHNGFEPGVGQNWSSIKPPGWDDFFPALGASYFTTSFVKDGIPFALTDANPLLYPERYQTAAENREANRLIRDHVAAREAPFFLYIAPLAPHREAPNELNFAEDQPLKGMVEPRYRQWWKQLKQIRRADFNEEDFSDKPPVISSLKPLEAEGTDPAKNEFLQTDVDFRRRLLSLRSVDDLVRDLLATLDELQISDQTIVMFTSDHGYHLGQNRHIGKKMPYDRCTNIPMFVWGPGYFSPESTPRTHLLAHIDIAPTILQLAGRPIPKSIQGKSFYPLLVKSYQGSPQAWRPNGVLVEHWETNESTSRPIRTAYNSLRMHDTIYTEWSSGDREFYDLKTDPLQLKNRSGELNEAQISDFQGKIQFNKSEMPQPIASIEQPLFNNDVFFQAIEIKGLAEYSSPLRNVKLTITDVTVPDKERFWNGSGWTDEYSFVIAELSRRSQTIADWSYKFSPKETNERRYRITARAVAMNGDFQASPTTKHALIDAVGPYCQFTSPKNEDTVRYYQKLNVAGWARDEVGVRTVRLTLRDTNTKKFWSGTEWQDNPVSLVPKMNRMQGSANVLWNYEFTPPGNAGRVYAAIRVFNMDNVSDPQPRILFFNWSK